MPDFLDHLKAEILALERSLDGDPRMVKLRELRRVRTLYEGDSAATIAQSASLPPRKPATREMSPETREVIEQTERFLDGRTEPVPIRHIFYHVVDQGGCRVGGQDPVNGLSAILSRSGRFVAHGRAGWTLANAEERSQELDENEMSETETPDSSELSGAPKTNGAAPLSL